MTRLVITDLVRLAVLGLVSGGLGLAVNGLHRHPLPWSYLSPAQRLREGLNSLQPPGVAAVAAPRIIGLEEFQAYASGRKGIIVDARSAAFYRQGHVPGALNLPRETFAADYARQSVFLNARRGEPVAVYCSEADCPDSEMVAGALIRMGFRQLLIYKEGWEEWTQAGLATEVASAP